MSDESFKMSDWPVRVTSATATMKDKLSSADWYGQVWPDYSEWCNQTYGRGNWEYFYGQFLFKNEQDATAFRLRWL
jgi:hypothetical protein